MPSSLPRLVHPPARRLVIGIDEVGRGCIAGSVVASAVVWAGRIKGLADSKALSAPARARLVPLIEKKAHAFAIGEASAQEIDQINILQATFLAMCRAYESIPEQWRNEAEIWVDGNQLPPGLPATRVRLFIGGDATHAPIAAASVLAKEWRDAQMRQAALDWPGYGFEKHKGYGTLVHLAGLTSQGPCPIHRLSFAPVKKHCL